jgi:hypothetical protein
MVDWHPNPNLLNNMKKQDNNASFEGISEAEYNKRHMKALKDAEPSGRKKRRIKKEKPNPFRGLGSSSGRGPWPK